MPRNEGGHAMKINALSESEDCLARRLAGTYVLPLWLKVVTPSGKSMLFCARDARDIPRIVDKAYAQASIKEPTVEVLFRTPT